VPLIMTCTDRKKQNLKHCQRSWTQRQWCAEKSTQLTQQHLRLCPSYELRRLHASLPASVRYQHTTQHALSQQLRKDGRPWHSKVHEGQV